MSSRKDASSSDSEYTWNPPVRIQHPSDASSSLAGEPKPSSSSSSSTLSSSSSAAAASTDRSEKSKAELSVQKDEMVFSSRRWHKKNAPFSSSSTASSRAYPGRWKAGRTSSGAASALPTPSLEEDDKSVWIARWVRVTRALKLAGEAEAAEAAQNMRVGSRSPMARPPEESREKSSSECSLHSAETIITPTVNEVKEYSDSLTGQDVERLFMYHEERPFDPKDLVDDLTEFQKLLVQHMPTQRMCFVVKTRRRDFPDGATQVVRFYEKERPNPDFPAACFEVVFRRRGPATGPWRLYDHRLPYGMVIPPTDGLDKMASLSEATAWLRAVYTLLVIHEEREFAIQQLREDRQLFSDPSTQVSAIGTILLLLKFNFPIPAERRLVKSIYKFSVLAKFTGGLSFLPEEVHLYSRGERQHPLEEVLKLVQEDVAKSGRASATRPRFVYPLVELVHGWWEALTSVIEEAEANAAAAAEAARISPSASSSSSSSSTASSFPSLIVSPCKPKGDGSRSVGPRTAPLSPSPVMSPPRRPASHGPAPRHPTPRFPTPYHPAHRHPESLSSSPPSSPLLSIPTRRVKSHTPIPSLPTPRHPTPHRPVSPSSSSLSSPSLSPPPPRPSTHSLTLRHPTPRHPAPLSHTPRHPTPHPASLRSPSLSPPSGRPATHSLTLRHPTPRHTAPLRHITRHLTPHHPASFSFSSLSSPSLSPPPRRPTTDNLTLRHPTPRHPAPLSHTDSHATPHRPASLRSPSLSPPPRRPATDNLTLRHPTPRHPAPLSHTDSHPTPHRPASLRSSSLSPPPRRPATDNLTLRHPTPRHPAPHYSPSVSPSPLKPPTRHPAILIHSPTSPPPLSPPLHRPSPLSPSPSRLLPRHVPISPPPFGLSSRHSAPLVHSPTLLASRRYIPETPRRGAGYRDVAVAGSLSGATPRKRSRLSAPRRLLLTPSTASDLNRAGNSSETSIASRRPKSPVIRRIQFRGISISSDSEGSE